MRIMKVVDKKVVDITYYKYRINLPKEPVERLGFLDKELKIEVVGKTLIISKK